MRQSYQVVKLLPSGYEEHIEQKQIICDTVLCIKEHSMLGLNKI